MTHRAAGFTLIEMIIVTAFIGILAGVAVPNLVTARSVANERAVVATLRTLATAQAQCCAQKAIDRDADGCGEALSLGELAGVTGLRNGPTFLQPPSLPVSLGKLDAAGRVLVRGYLFALYLPDATGQGLIGTAANLANVDADLAETAWTCVAWPMTRGNTGNATFFVNQAGEIVVARQATYSGTGSVPPAGAALVGVPATTIVGGDLATAGVGADGNTWNTMR